MSWHQGIGYPAWNVFVAIPNPSITQFYLQMHTCVTVNINLISAKHKSATMELAAECLSTFRTEAHFMCVVVS
jgi:hypothetical protein